VQPIAQHEHWQVDFSYINIGGIFHFLCAVLDGCSPMIVAWNIRSAMRKIDSEIVLQKARETYPEARPRIITDQGPHFKGREFKSFIAQWQAMS
jgi:putative transposase